MRSTIVILVCLFGLPLAGQQVSPEVFVLDNGMKFLLLARDSQPNVITAGWVAKVGSVNERPGITGISHFFEHMMFKGTHTIGTKDPERDEELSGRQEEIRGKLRELHLDTQYRRWKRGEIEDPWDPANDTEEMRKLRAELREVQEEQRSITVKNEFDEIYTRMGGSGMNAFTTHDLTFYFINVPSNKLELWAWMESDRLRDSVFREFYEERDVVHEERRMRTESTPTGIYQEQFDALFWQSSPYSWPVIGWTSDLNSYTRKQAQEYYATYYCPNNLVGVVVGDFEVAPAKKLITRYFGRLQRGPEPPPVVTLEMPQLAEKRMRVVADCPPQVEVRYHTVPFGHRDEAALEVLSEILNGRTGRLYKSLVEEKKIATSVRTGQDSRKYGGAFSFEGECQGDAAPESVEQAFYEEIDRLRGEPVGERELQKVKNGTLASSFRRLQSNFFLLFQLGYYEGLGDWEYVNWSPKAMQAVTADDIQAVIEKYFTPERRSVAIYLRKAGSSAPDDPVAQFPEQARSMVRTVLASVSNMKDTEKLQQLLERLEGNRDQAPEDMRPAMAYLADQVRARISEIEKEN